MKKSSLVSLFCILRGIILSLLLGFSTVAFAQSGATRAVQVHATTQVSPPRITLSWETSPHTVDPLIYIYRRPVGSDTWTIIGNVAPASTSYTDTTVVVGTRYEYKVYRPYLTTESTAHARGYIIVGIEAPLLDQRGKVILLVDSTKKSALAAEIARFKMDLAGDGWTVIEEVAEPTDTPQMVRAKLQAI